MSKIARYLNEHLTGEVLMNPALLKHATTDGSVLANPPEMVARVAETNDIRKIMRFCSQLVDKGHTLPVVVRGFGTDANGAAIGGGVSLDTSTHLKGVKGIDPKQQLIHVQAGMSHSAINSVMATHRGLAIPEISSFGEDGTIGGAISSGALASSLNSLPNLASSVQQLEVVLSSGDVLQTGRISKRELAKKKGLANFEGEVYRQIDNLIEDNKELVESLSGDGNTAGFAGIGDVKARDGSFDLTPLFVGSQGALGVITEVILKAGFVNSSVSVVLAAFEDKIDALAVCDEAAKLKASTTEVFDGRLFGRAALEGKKYSWVSEEAFAGGVAMVVFSDFSDRTRARAVKKLLKKINALNPVSVESREVESSELTSLRSVVAFSRQPSRPKMACPSVFGGLWLPVERIDAFLKALAKLEAAYSVELPFYVDMKQGFVDLLPIFDTHKISERQKIVKLVMELARILPEFDGNLAGRGGDGRLKAGLSWASLGAKETKLYSQIKNIFDPAGILSPGIKTEVPVKELVAELNNWCRLQS